MRYLMIVLSMCMWANVVNAADPKSLEGEEVSIVFICKSQEALENILSAKTAPEMMEAANQYVASEACMESPYPVPVDLTEYLGEKIVTATGFTGIAYIYRVEGNSGQNYYTFLFEQSKGA